MTMSMHLDFVRLLIESVSRLRSCLVRRGGCLAAASATHHPMQNKCVTVWTVESITSKKLKRGTDLLKTRKNKETGCALGGCAQHAAPGTSDTTVDEHVRRNGPSLRACVVGVPRLV